MSQPPQSSPPQDAPASVDGGDGADALPVLSGAPRVVRAQPRPDALPAGRRSGAAAIPAVQAAAVAAGGFVAGAAVAGLVHRRHKRTPALYKGGRIGGERGRRSRRGGRAGELVQIVGSRSLLLDVHLLGGAGDR